MTAQDSKSLTAKSILIQRRVPKKQLALLRVKPKDLTSMKHTVAMIVHHGILLLPTGSKLNTTNNTPEVGDAGEEAAERK